MQKSPTLPLWIEISDPEVCSVTLRLFAFTSARYDDNRLRVGP